MEGAECDILLFLEGNLLQNTELVIVDTAVHCTAIVFSIIVKLFEMFQFIVKVFTFIPNHR